MTGHKDGFVFFFSSSQIGNRSALENQPNNQQIFVENKPSSSLLSTTANIYLCGNTHIGASLVAQIVKNPLAMWETWVGSMGWEDLLEEGMEIHSSILAWRIPWTDEPGGLQAMRSQKVRHDSGIKHSTQHTHYPYMG